MPLGGRSGVVRASLPWQVTIAPVPGRHSTRLGVAVTTTVVPRSVKLELRTPQLASDSHNHVGRLTTARSVGL